MTMHTHIWQPIQSTTTSNSTSRLPSIQSWCFPIFMNFALSKTLWEAVDPRKLDWNGTRCNVAAVSNIGKEFIEHKPRKQLLKWQRIFLRIFHTLHNIKHIRNFSGSAPFAFFSLSFLWGRVWDSSYPHTISLVEASGVDEREHKSCNYTAETPEQQGLGPHAWVPVISWRSMLSNNNNIFSQMVFFLQRHKIPTMCSHRVSE